jgi:hypothetical protein
MAASPARKSPLAGNVFIRTLTGMTSAASAVSALRQELQRRNTLHAASPGVCSTGVPALDQLLPARGLKTGDFTEWLSGTADGGLTFALLAASQALRTHEGAAVAVIDQEGWFYPAALPRWGIPFDQLLLLRPKTSADALWSWEQTLRCPGIAACVGWLPEASSVALRRLQVAAEQGGGLGLLVRPLRALQSPTWAEVRWRVTPAPINPLKARPGPMRGRRFRVELVRCRSQLGGGVADVEFSPYAAIPLRVVSALADPAPALRATGS